MNTNDNQNKLTNFESNAPLAEDLKSLFSADISIPAEIDHAVMDQARKHLATQKPHRRKIYWGAYAAAAVIAIAALFLNISRHHNQPPLAKLPVNRKDIDSNGTVNILDAFALARTIKSQQVPDEQWDINNDGRIDQQDVDAVAIAAVQLNEGVL